MKKSPEVARLKDNVDPSEKNGNWHIHFKGMTADDIRRGFLNNLEYNLAKDQFTLTDHDTYLSLAYTIRERLIERWIITQQQYHYQNVKRVYYLSFEFLMGRLLENNIVNLELPGAVKKAIGDLDLNYEDIIDQEPDAGAGAVRCGVQHAPHRHRDHGDVDRGPDLRRRARHR